MKNKYQEALDVVKKTNLRSEHYVQFEEDNIENVYEEEIKILQKLVDKETPKKPITIKPEGNSIWDYPTDRIKCPNCSIQLPMKKNCLKKKNPILYCSRCGQKLDWSE